MATHELSYANNQIEQTSFMIGKQFGQILSLMGNSLERHHHYQNFSTEPSYGKESSNEDPLWRSWRHSFRSECSSSKRITVDNVHQGVNVPIESMCEWEDLEELLKTAGKWQKVFQEKHIELDGLFTIMDFKTRFRSIFRSTVRSLWRRAGNCSRTLSMIGNKLQPSILSS